MKLNKFFAAFLNDESGAVTVDWVVLAAATVGLGALIGTTIIGNAETLATGTGTFIGTIAAPS
ncbi:MULTISPECIES: hypothetical protein [Donghicola]|jgi:Flp pilus assembly pilin Flp|uniref:Putative Flp pilus assembly protein n=1 Tax=Donghicola eburneus TaxID=393278 RepID=A0A1M4MZ84_9RHOB|nr:putative Flp pilus assembly protein [Donghicola eburneus]SFQ72040.1 hypothetical protein SAMN05421764_11235 [Donghicola eburneus]